MQLKIFKFGTEGFSAIRDEWEKLHRSLFPTIPFTSPLWNELWWKHCRKDSLFARDDLLLLAVRDCEERLLAVAPMVRTARPAVGPFRINEIQFFGADPNITEIRGTICNPADQASVLDRLHRFVHELNISWDWVRWQGVHGDDHQYRPGKSSKFFWVREIPDYFVELPRTWPEFEKSLTRPVRKAVRQALRKLNDDGHEFEFKVAVNSSELPAALNHFYRLHKERTKVRSYDAFARPERRNFLNEYCAEMARRGLLRIYSISVADKVVATRIGFAFGNQLYLYHSGNDLEWDQYSIMTVLLGEIFRSAISNGFEYVNLSTGTDRSKTRWRPKVENRIDGVEYRSGVRLGIFCFYELARTRGRDRWFNELGNFLKHGKT